MSVISRQLSRTNEERQLALNAAKTKNDNLPAGVVVLMLATKNRLDAIQPVYNSKMNLLGAAGFASTNATTVKNAAQAIAKMWVGHYYQALNNAIARGEYPASVRQFFLLDVNSDATPEMETEATVELWGDRVTSGETAMIAGGFAAMPYPSQPNVKLKVDDYKAKLIVQSNLMDATDLAQGAVQAQNEEADKVIKKVWDEVEAYYNEDTPENVRNNAAEWGVKYITLGDITELTFSAVHMVNNTPEQDVKYKIVSTGKTYESHHTDTVVAETRVVGNVEVIATKVGFREESKIVTIVEGQPLAVKFTLVPL